MPDNPTQTEPWRDPSPRPDARRLDDYVTTELASLPPTDDGPVEVRRRGKPMPPSRVTPEYRAWLDRQQGSLQ